MLHSLIAALQPAGLLLVGVGIASLVFSGPLARLDEALASIGMASVHPEHSRAWVEVAGAVWGFIGVALLIASHFAR